MRNPPSGNEWIAHLPNAGLEGCFLLELGLLAFESFRFLMRWNHFGLKRINCLSQTRANKFGDGKGCIENVAHSTFVFRTKEATSGYLLSDWN